MIFCFKNLIFSKYEWAIANRSWGWNKLSNFIHFQNKVWHITCSILKKSTFLKFFWTQNDLAWITAIFCFKKYDTFLPIFCKTQNFGHLVWALRVAPELYDIGGSESIIWSTPSSNGLVIGPLLASGGRKNLFFLSGVGGWNNQLHIIKRTNEWWKSTSKKLKLERKSS